MDKDFMGKVRCNYKTKLITVIILAVLLLISISHAASFSREFELFDQGYKYYLSYQPEKAVEEFKTFLKEFPNSSAKDAVMFWLGKSLLQLKSFEEARQIFFEVKQQFPGSPFISHTDKELEVINREYGFAKALTGGIDETKKMDNAPTKTEEPEPQVKIQEKEIQKAPEEREGLKPLPEKEREETPKTIETAAAPGVTAGSEETLRAGPAPGKRVIYSIQIGVFKKQKTADNLRLEFKKEGYPVNVMKGTSKGEDVFKVLVGAFDNRNDAELIARKLKRKYGANAVVSMPEVSEEMQVARADSVKTAEDRDRLRPLSESVEKKTEELSTGVRVTQPGSETAELRDTQAKSQEQLKTKEEAEKHGEASKAEGEQLAVGPEALEAGKKEIGVEKEKLVSKTDGQDVQKAKVEDRKAPEEGEGLKPLAEQERGETLKKNETMAEPSGAVASEKPLSAAPALDKHAEATKTEKEEVSVPIQSPTEEKEQITEQSRLVQEAPLKEAESGDRQGSLFEPGKKKPEELTAIVTQPESKPAELKDIQAKSQEQQNQEEVNKQLETLQAEKGQLDVPVQSPKDEKGQTEKEKEQLKSDVSGSDVSGVRIKDRRYTVQEISEYMTGSESLLGKLHIKEVLWRTGNDNEDFSNEQVLYNEAKSLSITTDMNSLREMTEKYQLDDREADYLQRYLIISDFIDGKIKDMPEEKVVESLIVKYGEGDKYMKIVLDTELQNLARNGTPFEEIYRLYPDLVRFMITGFQEAEERVKEKIQPLQDNDIVVTWSGGGYMILKPVSKGPVVKPFGDVSAGLRDRIRTYIIPWIKGLREKYATGEVNQQK